MDGDKQRSEPPREKETGEQVVLEKRYGAIGCGAIKAAAMARSDKRDANKPAFPPRNVREQD